MQRIKGCCHHVVTESGCPWTHPQKHLLQICLQLICQVVVVSHIRNGLLESMRVSLHATSLFCQSQMLLNS